MRRNEKPSKPIIALTIILLLVVAYFAITSTAERFSQPEKKELVVGTSTPFPPFEYKAGDNEVVGFDIDLAKKIAEKADKRLVIKDFANFDSLFPALKAGEIDMIAAAVTSNEERKEIAALSQPYYQTEQGVLACQDSSFSCYGSCGPNHFANLSVGYQLGTTNEDWAEKNLNGSVNVKCLQPFDDFQMGLQLLKLKKIDVIITDKPAARNFILRNNGIKMVGNIASNEEYVFAVQKDDPNHLLPSINEVISEVKKGDEYEQLIKKWVV